MSVSVQTLREIEIICVNDGSTDNSQAVLKKFAAKDNRFIIIEQKNSGAANARNAALQRVTAPYIAFVDSDDFIVPDMLEKAYGSMVKHKVDFVEWGAESVFTYNVPDDMMGLRSYFLAKHQGIIKVREIYLNSSRELWKCLLKRKLIEKYNLRFAVGFSSHEDTIFLLKYKAVSKSGLYINENLYFYFIQENTIMGRTKGRKNGMRILEKIQCISDYYNFLIKNNLFDKLKLFFWDEFCSHIFLFYQWAAPEIIQSHGVNMIKGFLKGKDISYLTDDKYRMIHCLASLEKEKLYDLSFLNDSNPQIVPPLKKKLYFRKFVKWLLPYGLVRLIQIWRER